MNLLKTTSGLAIHLFQECCSHGLNIYLHVKLELGMIIFYMLIHFFIPPLFLMSVLKKEQVSTFNKEQVLHSGCIHATGVQQYLPRMKSAMETLFSHFSKVLIVVKNCVSHSLVAVSKYSRKTWEEVFIWTHDVKGAVHHGWRIWSFSSDLGSMERQSWH